MIAEAAGAIRERNNLPSVTVRMPLIGCGAYLTALTSKDSAKALGCFADALEGLVPALASLRVVLEVCDFSGGTLRDIATGRVRVLQRADLFALDMFALDVSESKGADETTVAAANAAMDATNAARDATNAALEATNAALEATILVNAWDDVSFVGNGGARDPTIDGFLVAGGGPGAALVNCSYLHNAFFVPELLNPSRWRDLA